MLSARINTRLLGFKRDCGRRHREFRASAQAIPKLRPKLETRIHFSERTQRIRRKSSGNLRKVVAMYHRTAFPRAEA